MAEIASSLSPDHPSPALARSRWSAVVWGSLGFTLVSLVAFSVWAFGGRWFGKHGGEGVLYAAIAAVFVLLTGLLLHPLLQGEHRFRRFTAAFVPAFLAYAVVWSGFWFWLKFGLGERIGALAGSLVFVKLVRWRLPSREPFLVATAVFFLLHTVGYFAGGQSMAWLLNAARQVPTPFADAKTLVTLAKLSWGLFYGLGFGAGLGWVIGSASDSSRSDSVEIPVVQ